ELFNFADRIEFDSDGSRAGSMFFENLNYDFFECDDEFINARYFEWFSIDYVMANGQTLIDLFIERNIHRLSRRELGLLNSWKKSRISLYEIEYVDCRGKTIVRDLLRGGTYRVYGSKITGVLEKDSVVLMRLIEVGKHYEYSTNGIALPVHIKSHLVNLIQEDYLCSKALTGDKGYGWGDYLREKAHVINNLVVELGWAESLPDLLTIEGNEFVESKAIYDITDYPEFLRIIEKSTHYTILESFVDKHGIDTLVYNWMAGIPYKYAPGRKGEHVHGKIYLTKDEAVLQCSSKERLEKGKFVVNDVFHGVVRHKKDHFVNVKSKMLQTMIDNINLSMLESPEKNRPVDRSGELHEISNCIDDYNWENHKYVDAAVMAIRELSVLGYKKEEQDFALFLWNEYCEKERPLIKKPSVWAAVLVYTMARLGFDSQIHQKDLAKKFGVSPSTISTCFRALCRTLELDFFDRFFRAQKVSSKEIKNIKQLLFDIFGNLKV
ncbi:MAG TPA: hypothetical protein VFD15_02925, partial [Clostridia bacterium]|nr:hypothetical protein [Clostridia bacterium]